MVKQVSGDLSQRLHSVWWYIMFVTSNTWTVTVPWCRPKFWCQDYKNTHQKTLLKLGVEQMENWITFLTLNLVVALFWFLGTHDTIMFVSHTHKCEWLQRGLSLYTLDQFASVVNLFFILSICFPNWQLNSVFYSVYVSDDKWQHLCITVMHVTSNILNAL